MVTGAVTVYGDIWNAGVYYQKSGTTAPIGDSYYGLGVAAFSGAPTQAPSASPTSSSSDRRLKTNILPISNSLAKVKRLRGVYFHWIADKNVKDKRRNMGFIAQDVQTIVPEAVGSSPDGKHLTVNYPVLVSLLTEAVKELAMRIERVEVLFARAMEERSRVLAEMENRLATKLEERLTLFVKLHSLGLE